MDDQDWSRQIAYREELLKKARLAPEDRLWLISHPCFHQQLGVPFLIQDIIDFQANTPCLFSVVIEENEAPSSMAPCFLTVGDGKKNYLVSRAAVSDRAGQISIGKRIQSLSISPASKHSQFLAFSERGKLRVQYECAMLDAAGREQRFVCSRSPWLAMKKTQISDSCVLYDCASPPGVWERRETIRAERRILLPEDLMFGRFRFTVSWERE